MITIPVQQLKAVAIGAATKDVRYYLKGVLMEVTTCGDIHLVATDGEMMVIGRSSAQWTGEAQKGPWSMIIPIDAIKTALKGCKQPMITLATMGDRYMLGDVLFVPVDGHFPAWRRVYPSNPCGEMAQYDPDLLTRARDAVQTWCGIKSTSLGTVIQHNGTGAGLVTVCAGLKGDTPDGADTVAAVVMPYRHGDVLPVPVFSTL